MSLTGFSVLPHAYVYSVFVILNGFLLWSTWKSCLGTADTLLLQWINNSETVETFKCSVVPVDAAAHTASVHRWDQIGKNV